MVQEIVERGDLLEQSQLKAMYRDRKAEYEEMSIPIIQPIDKDWELKREYKSKRIIRRKKPIHSMLEDKVWCLFYKLGVSHLSTKDFTIILKKRDPDKTKQIDVLAVDEDVAFVVECKSREKLGSKSLKKDIAEFAGNFDDIRKVVQKLTKKKLRIVFILATENIKWSENDKEDAKEKQIQRWDEYDLDKLDELIKHAGKAAKYHIYSWILYGKKIHNFSIKVPALKAKMGGKYFYSFVMSPNDLLKIVYVHRRTGHPNWITVSESYQRMINKNRIKDIKKYIDEKNGFFPGSIILNFQKPFTEEFIVSKKHLENLKDYSRPVSIKLPDEYGSAWIIDGQHRLFGYADSERKLSETIPVIAFVNLSPSDEAKMFLDINQNQKNVAPELLWDLYEDLYADSSDEKEKQKYVISSIAKKLNRDENSPFHGHIMIPKNISPKEGQKGNIRLTTICIAIKNQNVIPKNNHLLYNVDYDATIPFASDRIMCFFNVLKDYMKTEWLKGDKHFIRTNNGITVLMGIFGDIVKLLNESEIKRLSTFRENVEKFLLPVADFLLKADEDTISQLRKTTGAGPSSDIRYKLTHEIYEDNIAFRSPWYENYKKEKEEEHKEFKKKEGILIYLNDSEGDYLEFKGSFFMNLDRYLLVDNKLEQDSRVTDSILRTIVAFLNTDGGVLIVGVLEKDRFRNAISVTINEEQVYRDKIIFGIETDYGKNGDWDKLLLRLTEQIKNHIGMEVLQKKLIQFKKEEFRDRDLCVITVERSDEKQYLGVDFYHRVINRTEKLAGRKIDDYWKHRKTETP